MLAREDDGPFTDNVQTLGVHGFLGRGGAGWSFFKLGIASGEGENTQHVGAAKAWKS